MNKRLNQNIKNFRGFKGMTQEELGARIGKSKNVISNWERGDNSPDIDSVEKICGALGVTPNQLFGWEPYPEYEEYVKIMDEKRMELAILEQKRDEVIDEINKLVSTLTIEAAKFQNDDDKWRIINGDPKTSE